MFFTMTNGEPLNFKIIPYATEAALLEAAPAENTIGVITSTKITGWVFSPSVPTEATEGMLCVNIGTSSGVAFNALKRNCLMVHPISGKQYVSGSWVDVICKSYQNGAWVDWWNGELYDSGNMWESITGGWVAGEGQGGTVSFGEEYIELSTESGVRIHAETANPVDLSKYNTLVAKVSVVKCSNAAIRLGYAATSGTSLAAELSNKTEMMVYETGEYELSLDVSSVSEAMYIIVGLGYASNNVQVEFVGMK